MSILYIAVMYNISGYRTSVKPDGKMTGYAARYSARSDSEVVESTKTKKLKKINLRCPL